MSTWWICFYFFTLTMASVCSFVFYTLKRQTSGHLKASAQIVRESPYMQGKRDWKKRYLG